MLEHDLKHVCKKGKLTMSYISEFPDYDGDFYVPEGWEDNSWHNDVCPHIEKRSLDESVKVMIWQDYVDPDKRERDYCKRYLFQICCNGDDAQFYYETNKWSKIQKLMKGVNI